MEGKLKVIFVLLIQRYLAMINEHSSHLYLWDFESKRLRPHLEYGAVFNKIKWSPDGTYLAATCDKYKFYTPRIK